MPMHGQLVVLRQRFQTLSLGLCSRTSVRPEQRTWLIKLTHYLYTVYARCARGEHSVVSKHGALGIICAVIMFPFGFICYLWVFLQAYNYRLTKIKITAWTWRKNVKDVEQSSQDGIPRSTQPELSTVLLVPLSSLLIYAPLMLFIHEFSRSFTSQLMHWPKSGDFLTLLATLSRKFRLVEWLVYKYRLTYRRSLQLPLRLLILAMLGDRQKGRWQQWPYHLSSRR